MPRRGDQATSGPLTEQPVQQPGANGGREVGSAGTRLSGPQGAAGNTASRGMSLVVCIRRGACLTNGEGGG
eukprot:scaffold7379_cov126-Isochrysis_galbana.AAC.5